MKEIKFDSVEEIIKMLPNVSALYNVNGGTCMWEYNEWDCRDVPSLGYAGVALYEIPGIIKEAKQYYDGDWTGMLDGYIVDGIDEIKKFIGDDLTGWYAIEDIDLMWIDVYADTLGKEKDDNVAEVLVSREDAIEWFIANVKSSFEGDEKLSDEALFEDWLIEYTLDDTDALVSDFIEANKPIYDTSL